MTTILVACPEFEPYLRPGLLPLATVEARFCTPQDLADQLTPQTMVLVGEALPPPGPSMAGLRWIHLLAAGYDRLLGRALPAKNLLLSNSSGGFTTGIAEFVVMRMLMHAKKAEALADAQRQGIWARQSVEGRTLKGKCAVVLGGGSVGREVGRLCQAFGMNVAIAGRGEREKFKQLVADADYVIIAASLNASSRGMVDAGLLGSMKRKPYLVNIGRGALIDTPALVAALREGILSGAALDVFDQEPLPPDSPLWTLEGLSISPHTSGVYAEVWQDLAEVFIRNLNCFLAGEPLPNRISLEDRA
ncbi:MAG: D-2-hydroxyacid dehydrogenase [Bryobacteraceae bacterium]